MCVKALPLGNRGPGHRNTMDNLDWRTGDVYLVYMVCVLSHTSHRNNRNEEEQINKRKTAGN